MPTASRLPFSTRRPLPFASSPLDALPAAINHLLAAEPWARAQLAPFVGRTVEVVVAPFTIRLSVLPGGSVARAATGVVADTQIRVSGAAAIRFATGGAEAAMRDVQVSGDTDFAQAVSLLVRHLRWDVEDDLAKVTGDVVAHRVVGTAKGVVGAARRNGERLAAQFGEYWLEENPQLVRPRAVETFADGVRRLRDDLARLEKRVERLTRPPA
jgi:ubiquinone biosynthesis protein UbiJ